MRGSGPSVGWEEGPLHPHLVTDVGVSPFIPGSRAGSIAPSRQAVGESPARWPFVTLFVSRSRCAGPGRRAESAGAAGW